jgi:hypothetical protein
MERVLHPKKSYRNTGVVCLIFFLLVGVISTCGVFVIAHPERRTIALCMAVFFAVFWGFWVCLSCWILLAYWREQLEVGNGQVVKRGVIGRKQIDLESIAVARWRVFPRGGSIVVQTLTEKLTIHFDNFEQHERLWLIQLFHNELPDAVQENWALFCGRIALPLRDQNYQDNERHDPDTVVLTRRRWDWYLVPVILLSAIYGAVAWWQFQQPRMLMAPLIPAFLWLFLRFGTPRKGLASKRIGAVPGQAGFLLFLLLWFGVAIVGLVVFKIWQPPMPHAAILATAILLWFGVLFWRAHQADRARRRWEETNAPVAAQRWDDGETKA